MSRRKSTAKLKFRPNLFYDIIFKDTILDQFTHLAKYVVSCLESLDDNVNDTTEKSCGIIYCKNRETVDLVTMRLTEQGVLTKAHHGGIKDREKVQEGWMTGVVPVIAATTSFGDGIDKASVRFVVHWDVSRSVAKYYRESGLAGRDGQLSYCRIYYCKEDVSSIESTLTTNIDNATGNKLSKAIRAFDEFMQICNLCESVTCRHKMFADHSDEAAPKCNDRCDVCKNPSDVSVALSIFNRLTDALVPQPQATSVIYVESHVGPTPTLFTNGQSIKLEQPVLVDPTERFRPPRNVSPANTIIKEERNVYDSVIRTESFRPQRNVSPANTIIKEEGTEHFNSPNARIGGGGVNLSEELFEMQRRPPGHMSPARTIIKEELNRSNGLHLENDNLAIVSSLSPKHQQSTSAFRKRSRSRSSERSSKQNTQFHGQSSLSCPVRSNAVVEATSLDSSDLDTQGVRSTEPKHAVKCKDSTPLPHNTTECHQEISSLRRSSSRSNEGHTQDDKRHESSSTRKADTHTHISCCLRHKRKQELNGSDADTQPSTSTDQRKNVPSSGTSNETLRFRNSHSTIEKLVKPFLRIGVNRHHFISLLMKNPYALRSTDIIEAKDLSVDDVMKVIRSALDDLIPARSPQSFHMPPDRFFDVPFIVNLYDRKAAITPESATELTNALLDSTRCLKVSPKPSIRDIELRDGSLRILCLNRMSFEWLQNTISNHLGVNVCAVKNVLSTSQLKTICLKFARPQYLHFNYLMDQLKVFNRRLQTHRWELRSSTHHRNSTVDSTKCIYVGVDVESLVSMEEMHRVGKLPNTTIFFEISYDDNEENFEKMNFVKKKRQRKRKWSSLR